MPRPSVTPKLPSWKNLIGLYLDISRKDTGYCISVGHNILDYGSQSFEGYQTDGEMLMEFYSWLQQLITIADVDIMAVEYAAFQQGRALELWHNMMAIARITAYSEGVPFLAVPVIVAKKAVGGRKESKKAEIIKLVRKRYDMPDLDNDNIADAIAVNAGTPDVLYSTTYRIKWL